MHLLQMMITKFKLELVFTAETIEFEFELYNMTNIYISLGVIVLIIIIIVISVINKKKIIEIQLFQMIKI